jgi:iron complex outermembrane recepter protein
MTSTSPVQIVTAEDIKVGGRADITDVINNLPQIFSNTLGQDLGNRTSGLATAGGVATADLRGLGPNRTLVLVNGRRLGVGSPNTAIQSPAPDLDQIPSALLERVDVITGGASAVYGSDAVVGVVNFILKQKFEGFQIDYQTGQNWHRNDNSFVRARLAEAGLTPTSGTSRDGKGQSLTLLAGTNFADGKGNITAYFGYLSAEPVASGQRDFGGCQLNANDALDGADCGGSSNSNFFQLRGAPASEAFSVVGDQFVLRSDAASGAAIPPKVFNSQRFIYMGRDNKRYSAGFLGHVELNDYAQPYFELTFMNDKSQQEIAPSGLFRDSNPLDPFTNYNINCSNPFLSAQQAAILCTPAQIAADAATPGSASANVRIGRRNVEGGGRQAFFEHTNYRGVVGLKGELGQTWNYDAYAQYYYTQFFNSNDRFFDFQRITNALQVTGTAASPQCISGASCVPYNIFRDGGVVQDQLDYLYSPGTAYGNAIQRTVHADITGELGQYHIQSPWSAEGVAVNVGYEHRSEQLRFRPDSAETGGLLSGFGGAPVPIDNGQSVNEGFIEIRAPLIQDKPGVKELLFDAGFRRSDYSIVGAVSTHKFELQYAPVDDFRLRASFQRAIRAPSIIELFNPQIIGQIGFGADPCAPTINAANQLIPATATLAQCQNSGVTAAQYGNGGTSNTIPQGTANQLTQLQGGNPDLKSEEGDSYTIGLTFRPHWVPRLTGSIDYYHIKIDGIVGAISAQTIMNNCLSSGAQAFCNELTRSPANGGLNGATVAGGGYIRQTNINIGQSEISGVDLQMNYKWPVAPRWGTLGFALNGAWQQAVKTTQLPGTPAFDCVGLFGPTCARLSPKWRHTLRTTWLTPWKLDVSATWRFLGSMKLDSNDNDPQLHFSVFPAFNTFNARLPSASYLDLSASWNATKNIELRGGINNLFDKDPPIVTAELTAGGAANSYEIYDGLGRQLFVGMQVNF